MSHTLWRRCRRGVSDVLGFAVVFGVVVASIALVYTVGTAALADVRHAHAMDNTERAFDIVGENVADLHRNDAPGRATELQLAGGQLALSESTTITVTNTTEIEGRPVSADAVSTPIEYTNRESGLYYAGGAVIRTHRGTAVMVDEPPFEFGRERVVLTLVETIQAGGSESVGGTGSVHVSTQNEGSSIERIVDEEVTVEVAVTSPRYRAWARYFERQPGSVTVDEAANTVTYSVETDALYVRRIRVGVRLTT